MPKYLILYQSERTASEVMANSTSEQQKASMEKWIKWKDEVIKKVKFEFGMPIQVVTSISKSGETTSQNKAGGYSFMEGDKDTVVDVLKTHPHLDSPGNSIDVLEELPMEGIDS